MAFIYCFSIILYLYLSKPLTIFPFSKPLISLLSFKPHTVHSLLPAITSIISHSFLLIFASLPLSSFSALSHPHSNIPMQFKNYHQLASFVRLCPDSHLQYRFSQKRSILWQFLRVEIVPLTGDWMWLHSCILRVAESFAWPKSRGLK
jgi:hypothetical protein